jgi:hypothetical protein
MELVKAVSFTNILKVLGGNLSVVYYDVTTSILRHQTKTTCVKQVLAKMANINILK